MGLSQVVKLVVNLDPFGHVVIWVSLSPELCHDGCHYRNVASLVSHHQNESRIPFRHVASPGGSPL